IDLKSSELIDVAKILSLLKKNNVDAVIVKDLAIIYFINKYFPTLEIHLSTQFGIANSNAMQAAGDLLKAERVVLARELNYKEIKALDKKNFPEREVFIQGSMCFSFSGRCLMSSWNGGKSANRGACQAPCRFIYSMNEDEDKHSYFSMKDLSLLEKIDELKELNISAVKIEGRLKSSDWVGNVTSLYRNKLDNSKEVDIEIIKMFSGRKLAEGFYGGLDDLTSEQKVKHGEYAGNKILNDSSTTSIGKGKFNLMIGLQNNIVKISIQSDYGNLELSIPLKWIIKEKRAVSFSLLQSKIANISFGGLFLNDFNIEEDFLISRSQLKNIISEIGTAIAPLINKERKFLKGIKIPDGIEHELIIDPDRSPNNTSVEFKNATSLRILAGDIFSILNDIENSSVKKVIVDNCKFTDIKLIQDLAKIIPVEISLFPILFEDELPEVEKIIKVLEKIKNVSYEVNDIGHLTFLKNTGKNITGGPFLTPYNQIAAKFLEELGLTKVHVPLEADHDCLKGLSGISTKLRMTLYGRIPLFYSRAKNKVFKDDNTFKDSVDTEIVVQNLNQVSVFYSKEYFTAANIEFDHINVSELIVDLSGEKDILSTFEDIKKHPKKYTGNNFNLSKRLH
ncbi:MAG: U32 family peptidase, partial [Candidatus Delongbacteria bacterium]|nr:U32 family peptidase [Candidatus Delongbacteria bacterium]